MKCVFLVHIEWMNLIRKSNSLHDLSDLFLNNGLAFREKAHEDGSFSVYCFETEKFHDLLVLLKKVIKVIVAAGIILPTSPILHIRAVSNLTSPIFINVPSDLLGEISACSFELKISFFKAKKVVFK